MSAINAKKQQKKPTANESRSSAARRASELRERLETARKIAPGTVLNGEEGWSYRAIPKDASKRVKEMSTLDLETKGYELCTNSDVKFAGLVGAEIWQIPIESAKILKQIKKEERIKREKANRGGNILSR